MGTKSRKPRGLYLRGGIWYVRTDPVTGRPLSTGCREDDVAGAEAFLRARRDIAGRPLHAAAETASRDARLIDWIGHLIALRERQGRAPSTIVYARQKLGHFCRVLGRTDGLEGAEFEAAIRRVRLHDVQPPAVDRYVAVRREEGVTDHTISKEVTLLLQVLSLAARKRAYPAEWIDLLRPPDLTAGYVPRERAPTLEEVALLIVSLSSERLRVIVRLAVGLGVRLSEACALERRHFDLRRHVVQIPGTKTAGARATVPILELYRPLVLDCLPELPIGARPNNLYRDIAVACRRAGIEYCTPNDFRRAHASILAEHGVDADDVRRLLRHTGRSRVLERVYDQPRAEALGRRIDELTRPARCDDPETSLQPSPAPPSRLQPSRARVLRRPRRRNSALIGHGSVIASPPSEHAALAQSVEQRFRKPEFPRRSEQETPASTRSAASHCDVSVTEEAVRAVPELYAMWGLQ